MVTVRASTLALILLARAFASPIPAPAANAVAALSSRDVGFSADRILPRFPDSGDDVAPVKLMPVPKLTYSKAVDVSTKRDEEHIPVDADLMAAAQDGQDDSQDGQDDDQETEDDSTDNGDETTEGDDDQTTDGSSEGDEQTTDDGSEGDDQTDAGDDQIDAGDDQDATE